MSKDLTRRARLSRRDLDALAAANALKGLADHRHQARWAVLGLEPPTPLLVDPRIEEAEPALRAPTVVEGIADDRKGKRKRVRYGVPWNTKPHSDNRVAY